METVVLNYQLSLYILISGQNGITLHQCHLQNFTNNVLTFSGAYVKLPLALETMDLSELNSDTRYSIMFGPDRCGAQNKVHFIIQYENPVSKIWEEKHFNDTVRIKDDKLRFHLYTLHIKNNNDFEIYIDKKIAGKGNLLTHLDPAINPPREIDDETDKQPDGEYIF